MKSTNSTLNSECYSEKNAISALENQLKSDTITSEEVAILRNMISKKKQKLVQEIYKQQHPRSKGFCQTSRGLWKATGTNITGKTEYELIEKLYEYYFYGTLEHEFYAWRKRRMDNQLVSPKTIEEDTGIWNRVFSETKLAFMNMADITINDILTLYESWSRKVTKKEFCNRKSVLNGIFKQAARDGLIQINFIPSVPTDEIKYISKPKELMKRQVYTQEERQKMIDYLWSFEKKDSYILAILLQFHTSLRIGEIKGLHINSFDNDYIYVESQLVDRHELTLSEDEKTLIVGKKYTEDTSTKGNCEYSTRTIENTPMCKKIISHALECSSDNTYLFVHNANQLNTDTYNRRLKKYCKELGIPYYSSHKIRFCVTSMLIDNGMSLKEVSRHDGHSNLRMTEHYAERYTNPVTKGIVSQILG